MTLASLSDAIFQAMLCHGEIVTIRFAVALAQMVRAHGRLSFTLRELTYACDRDGTVDLESVAGVSFSAGPARARIAA